MGEINLWWKGIKIYWRESIGGNFSRWGGMKIFLADRGEGGWESPGWGNEGVEFPSVLKKEHVEIPRVI